MHPARVQHASYTSDHTGEGYWTFQYVVNRMNGNGLGNNGNCLVANQLLEFKVIHNIRRMFGFLHLGETLKDRTPDELRV
jgi:hypothetical protein